MYNCIPLWSKWCTRQSKWCCTTWKKPSTNPGTFVLQEWRIHLEGEEFQSFVSCKDELSVSNHVLLWGSKVVVPQKARERVIDVLHSTHHGVRHMKSLVRSYVWWPSMDTEIENHVKSCHPCQENFNSLAKALLHPRPERAWSRVHVDYASPFEGSMFLIVVDAYSKWMEVVRVWHATPQTTIEKLRVIFATHDLLEMLVSDNGTPLTSAKFQEFVSRNAIRHVLPSQYKARAIGTAGAAMAVPVFARKKWRTTKHTCSLLESTARPWRQLFPSSSHALQAEFTYNVRVISVS